jgi:hypothetical protein
MKKTLLAAFTAFLIVAVSSAGAAPSERPGELKTFGSANSLLFDRSSSVVHGRASGLIPTNVDYHPATTMHGKSSGSRAAADLPEVVDFSDSAFMPEVGDQGAYGSCVSWAFGYYYKTFQERSSGDLDVGESISPYFLFDNGGGLYVDFLGELMRGTGCLTLSAYSEHGYGATNDEVAAAARYKTLGYEPFFINSVSLNEIDQLAKTYNNNVVSLKAWLSADDLFVVCIPIYTDFPNYTSGVYEAPAIGSKVEGYHALCVVGYDNTKGSKGAFHFVNSWSVDWGEDGFGWLGYDFVAKYAVEAWRLTDVTGLFVNQYDIAYKGAGVMAVDTTGDTGITITGGGPKDTLSIKTKGKIVFKETIPSITTDGSFARLQTAAPVGTLTVDGTIGSLTTSGAYIGEVDAAHAQRISMTDSPNSSWATLAQWVYLQTGNTMALAEPGLPNNFSRARIDVTGGVGEKLSVSLVGVELLGLDVDQGDVTIKGSSKKNRGLYRSQAPYVSYSGVPDDDTNYIQAPTIVQMAFKGGAIEPKYINADNIGNISATGGVYSTRPLYSASLWYYGNVSPDVIVSANSIGSINSAGGNIIAYVIEAAENIGSLTAKSQFQIPLDRRGIGGYIGFDDDTNIMQVRTGLSEAEASGTLADKAAKTTIGNIRSIYADWKVEGQFLAGYEVVTPYDLLTETVYDTSGVEPTLTGNITSIGTNSEGSIVGESWTQKAIKTVRTGDSTGFVQNTATSSSDEVRTWRFED